MRSPQHKLLFASACLGMFLFGITITTLGAILPEIIPRFGLSKTDAGSLFTVMNLGILIGSLVFGPVVDRFGYKKLLVICTFLLLIGIEGVAFSATFSLFTFFIFFFGLGGGVLNGATNALVSDISVENRTAGLAVLGIFFGVGAFGMPLILGSLLNLFTYTQIIAALGSIVLMAMIFFMILKFPEPKHPHSFPLKEALSLIKHPTLLLLALMLFFQSGLEITTGGWTATYFHEVLNVETSTAVLLLSFFWIGMMLSRMAISRLLKNHSPAKLLKLSVAIAFTGSLILLSTGNITLSTFSIFLIGGGFGAGFPIVLGYIGDLYPNMSGTAFSIAFTIALTGGMVMPYLAGVIGDLTGLQSSFLIIPAGLIAFILLLFLVQRRFTEHHAHIKP